MRTKQPLIIALIISFVLVVCVGVLILNWYPQEVPNQPVNQSISHSSNLETDKENAKDPNISSDSAQERPSAEVQVSQQHNEQTSTGQEVITQPVVPQIPNTNSGLGETTPEQNINEQSKQEDLLDRIERSIKEALSKASLVPIKS